MNLTKEQIDSVTKRLIDGSIFEPNSGCLLWSKAPYKGGHGVIGVGRDIYFTHRISFFLHNNYIVDDLCVCHKCDTPECINPDHLELGSHKKNSEDMVKRLRHYTHKNNSCRRGHEFTKENTTYQFNSRMNKNQRLCKSCMIDARQRLKDRKPIKEPYKKPFKDFCKNGHAYCGDNLRILKNGKRVCLSCRIIANIKRKEKRKLGYYK